MKYIALSALFLTLGIQAMHGQLEPKIMQEIAHLNYTLSRAKKDKENQHEVILDLQNHAQFFLGLQGDIVLELVKKSPITPKNIELLRNSQMMDVHTERALSRSLDENPERIITIDSLISRKQIDSKAIGLLCNNFIFNKHTIQKLVPAGSKMEQKIQLIINAWLLLGDTYRINIPNHSEDPKKALACYDAAFKLTNDSTIIKKIEQKKQRILS